MGAGQGRDNRRVYTLFSSVQWRLGEGVGKFWDRVLKQSPSVCGMVAVCFVGAPFRHASRAAAFRIRLCSTASVGPPDSRKKIVFLGSPSFAASSLRQIRAAEKDMNINVSMVVTQPPQNAGRKRVLTPTPVHILADELGIDVLAPIKASDPHFLEKLRELEPDLCITAAYGNFLPSSFLKIPKFGTLNIHPSLLPAFRGAAPVPRALEAGVKRTGVRHLHFLSRSPPKLRTLLLPLLEKLRRNLRNEDKTGLPSIMSSLF